MSYCEGCAMVHDLQARLRAAEVVLKPMMSFWSALFNMLRDDVTIDSVDLAEAAEQEGLIALADHAQPCSDEACLCDGADEMYVETTALREARAMWRTP